MFYPYIDTDTAVDLYTWVNDTFKQISGFSKEYIIDCDLFLQFINDLNYVPPYKIVNSSVSRIFPNLWGYKTVITNLGAEVEVVIKEDTILSNEILQKFCYTKDNNFITLVQKMCDQLKLATAENYNFRLLKQFIDDPNESFQEVVYKLLATAFFNFTESRNGAAGCMINNKWFSMTIDRQTKDDTALGVYVVYDGMSVLEQHFTDANYREF